LPPERIFRAILNDWVLDRLVRCTNLHAARSSQKRATEYPEFNQRGWRDVNKSEMLAYIGTLIWMGLYPVPHVETYWNCDPDKVPLHQPITRCFAKGRWQQIHRYFHIFDPQEDFNIIRPNSGQIWSGQKIKSFEA
jgi:hypothetical protein